MPPFEPIALSRTLGRLASDAKEWEWRLRGAPSYEDNPFAFERESTTLTQYQIVSEELRSDDALRAPLLRWLRYLLEQRVNHWWYTHVNALRYSEHVLVQDPTRGSYTLQTVQRNLLTGPYHRQWLASYAAVSADLSSAVSTFWQRKTEVAMKFGLTSPWQDAVAVDVDIETRADNVAGSRPPIDAVQLAGRVLSETADIAAAIRTERAASQGLPWIDVGLASIRNAEFPSRITEHQLAEWFRVERLLEGVELRSWPLPEALAPSSFQRALQQLGAEFRYGLSSQRQPFVVRHDPYGLEQERFGGVFSGLLLNPAFLARKLLVAPGNRRDVLRVFAGVVLFELRLRAAAVLLRRSAYLGRKELCETHEEVTYELFGEPLAASLAGVMPRLRENAEARFVGLALGHKLAVDLTLQHQEDWFRNPRGVEHLRALAAQSPEAVVSAQAAEYALDAQVSFLRTLLA